MTPEQSKEKLKRHRDNWKARALSAENRLATLGALLPDHLYAGSKDWAEGDVTERVNWLLSMYESAKGERDAYLDQLSALEVSGNTGQLPKPECAHQPLADAIAGDPAPWCGVCGGNGTIYRRAYWVPCPKCGGESKP